MGFIENLKINFRKNNPAFCQFMGVDRVDLSFLKTHACTPAPRKVRRSYLKDSWHYGPLPCDKTNHERVEAAYRACYREAGLRDDIPFIWVDSPAIAAMAFTFAHYLMEMTRCGKITGPVSRREIATLINHFSLASARRGLLSAIVPVIEEALSIRKPLNMKGRVGKEGDCSNWQYVAPDIARTATQVDVVKEHIGWSIQVAVEQCLSPICRLLLAKNHLGDFTTRDAWSSAGLELNMLWRDPRVTPSKAMNKWRAVDQENIARGSFAWADRDFVIASERASVIQVDEDGLPHKEGEPAMLWPDGWGVYFHHGVAIPPKWVTKRDIISPMAIIEHGNIAQVAAGFEVIGWRRVINAFGCTTLDRGASPDIGDLIEVDIPRLDRPLRFLRAQCPRNGVIIEGVPHVDDFGLPINSALRAQAWRIGLHPSEYYHPEIRT